jgi:hypothetical protein
MKNQPQFHFYGSNFREWRTSTNLQEVIDHFRTKENASHNFAVWYIPLSTKTEYMIEWYEPQVEGRIYLGSYNKKKRVDINQDVTEEVAE